jgi:hypothetical protein
MTTVLIVIGLIAIGVCALVSPYMVSKEDKERIDNE